ncbi:MAG: carboxypeptidase-like regulatory domain-containing protein [Fidelibacterota bacterium]
MIRKSNRLLSVLALILPLGLMAQATITGSVTSEDGAALAGANVIVEGTSFGAAANAAGDYKIVGIPAGNYVVTASFVGYEASSKTVAVPSSGSVAVNFALSEGAIKLSGLEVLASRATRNTPVAYTNVVKQDMELRLGSQDIPMVLNITPSVYATQQGGGAGDARINVRGFNQRNVSVMINGVPQNDMENGWVYWSNWDGVGDATSSIQMQRGLSAVNLATPSIGGTMNIITDPTGHSSGGKFKQEIGNDGFLKSTLNYNTGLIGNKMAFSTTIVRKTGEGLIDKTWTDAWAYYFGASYALNNNNRFELYAIGAPQRHGQNLYKQNVAAYDKKFAETVVDEGMKNTDSDGDSTSDWDEYFDKFSTDDGEIVGREFNQNWAPINSSYKGKQYWYMYGARTVERHDPNFLNERENYFHKPLVNLNWFLTLSEQMRLSTIFYWSGGSGGGTGTYGSILSKDANGKVGDDDWKFYYGPSPWTRDWDGTVALNEATAGTVYVDKKAIAKDNGESVGILRNSINRQWTIGAISKLNFDVSKALRLQAGVDWRTAEIEHAREVRDLLGGDYYVYDGNEFDETETDYQKTLGDIIAYHNTNTVDWIGFFGQAEYATNMFSAYGMFGFSTIEYTFTDHFAKAENHYSSDTDGDGEFDAHAEGYGASSKGELQLTPDPISSIQFKGGGMFHVSSEIDVFANYGNVEKVPILDAVIDDNNGTLSKEPANEVFKSFEVGLNYHAGLMAAKLNYYNTQWIDRTVTLNVNPGQGSSGDTDIIFLKGLDQSHTGIEVELAFQPISMLRLDASFSKGNWEFVDDAKGDYKAYETGTTTEYVYAVKGLKVGDMPQTSMSLAASVYPIKGLALQAVFNSYDDHYADWDPLSREVDDSDGDGVISDDELSAADRDQSWKAPGYSKVDLHMSYNLPVDLGGVKLQLFAHIFNALDEVYVQDATDNSRFNGYKIEDEDGNDINSHSAARAEVFLGLPRTFNAGLLVRF